MKETSGPGKTKECELVGKWEKSIINHMYWCVASTPDGNGDLIKAKWLSLNNHMHYVHSGHSDLFPVCAHDELEIQDRKKKWLRGVSNNYDNEL